MRNIRVGCCGFPVAQSKYYQQLQIIEVNQTFYQIPELKTAQRWREQAPKDFEFIVKAWQLITHPANSLTYRRLREKIPEPKRKYYGSFNQTDEVMEAWHRTYEFGQILKAKIYLFQCPVSFRPTLTNITNISKFFKSFNRGGLTFVWEPRGDWPDDVVVKLCRDLNLVHCVDPTRNKPLYGHIRYYRLHGTYEGNRIIYDYEYSLTELNKILALADRQLTYVLLNNSTMWSNAIKFLKLHKKLYNLI